MGQHPTVQRGRRDIDAGGAKVGHHQVTRVAPEGQLPGWPAARARPDLTLDDQPAVDELPDPLCDDAPTQPRAVDQLGARPGATEADLVEHRDQRVERVVGHRRTSTRVPGHGNLPRLFRHAAQCTFGCRVADFCT